MTPKPFNLNDAVQGVINHFQNRLSGEADVRGLSTGYPEIDMSAKGLKPGEVFVIAGRPSMGKTTLMLNIVEYICIDQKIPVMIVSCGQTAADVVGRIIFSRAGFALSRLDSGDVPTPGDLERIHRAATDTLNARLIVDDAIFSIEDLRDQVRHHMREENIGFIAIDHLQLLMLDAVLVGATRNREVSIVLSGIKSLAREFGVPILILAELNRRPERRKDQFMGVPRLSDLRSDKTIIKYADLIGLLYREVFYNETVEEENGKGSPAKLILSNLRQIGISEVSLTFHPERRRFDSTDKTNDQAARNAPIQ